MSQDFSEKKFYSISPLQQQYLNELQLLKYQFSFAVEQHYQELQNLIANHKIQLDLLKRKYEP